jgi:hypothetical protein
MTLDQQRRAGFVELAAGVAGFAVLWHVGGSVTNVAESCDFAEILERARAWAQSEGVPLVRGLH